MQLDLYRIIHPGYTGEYMIHSFATNSCTAIDSLQELSSASVRVLAGTYNYFTPHEEGTYICTFDSDRAHLITDDFPELFL